MPTGNGMHYATALFGLSRRAIRIEAGASTRSFNATCIEAGASTAPSLPRPGAVAPRNATPRNPLGLL
jgi:hypothetical protein